MKKILFIFVIIVIAILFFYKQIISKDKIYAEIDKQELTFGVHPFLDKPNLINKFRPLVDYLSEAINKKITLKVSPSYLEHEALVGNNVYDFSYVGPISYIHIVEKFNEKYILASMTTYDIPFFNGIIFTKAESELHAIAELKGKTMAFGKKISTMSSIVPQIMLKQAGVTTDNLSNYAHLDNHETVVQEVLSGNFSAGAVKEAVYDKYKHKGLKQLARSIHISEHVFIASNTMPKTEKQKIKSLLINLANEKEGKEILAKIKPRSNRLVSTDDHNFNSLREYLDINTRFKWDFQIKK